MPRGEQPAALKRKQDERSAKVRARLEQALRDLKKAKQPVTVAAVVREAGVHRTTLYLRAYRDLLEKIRAEEVMGNQSPAPRAVVTRTSEESWKTRYELATLEVKRLKEENRMLREQLARTLGAARERR